MASTSTMHSRESDSDTIPFCPILHPTVKEFSDFNSYIEKLEKEYSQNYGMVKVCRLDFICKHNKMFIYLI